MEDVEYVAAMFLPLLLITTACQIDPEARSATTYVAKLQPLMQENSLLAERVLYQAAAIYNGATRPDEVADAWSSDIVPLAEHLHHQAGFVEPPENWSQQHAALVAVWGERAHAYRSISEGLERADKDLGEQGRNLAEQVKLKEESWFEEVNGQIGPMGFTIDAYP